MSSIPYDAPVPGAVGQMNVALLGKTAYNNTLARINRQRGQSLQQYGYQGDVDPNTGVLTNVHVDPNSRYGDFQSMLRNQATIAQQAEYANQDRGLRGGMANKALSDARYGFGQQSAQLGTNFANTFTDYQDQQTQAKADYDRALYEQQLQDAQAAIAAGNFNPAGDGGDGSGGDGSDGWTQVSGSTGYPDPYTAGAAAAVAGGYGGYVHPAGGGSPAKPSAARVAKTTAKVTAKKSVAGWKQVK
jgi:hypothetical protein